jgi:hypothetical protein
VVSCQFVFEFINAALHGRSAVVIAPDFQRGVAAIGDENPKNVTRQINELAANGPPAWFAVLRAPPQSAARSSKPGAGPELAPRLLGEMGDDRERFDGDAKNLRNRPGRSRLALRQFL